MSTIAIVGYALLAAALVLVLIGALAAVRRRRSLRRPVPERHMPPHETAVTPPMREPPEPPRPDAPADAGPEPEVPEEEPSSAADRFGKLLEELEHEAAQERALAAEVGLGPEERVREDDEHQATWTAGDDERLAPSPVDLEWEEPRRTRSVLLGVATFAAGAAIAWLVSRRKARGS